MRLTTLAVSFLFCSFASTIIAQDFEFSSSIPIDELLPLHGKGFLLTSTSVKEQSDSLMLFYFDELAQPKNSINIALNREIGEMQLESIFVWNEKVMVLKSLFYPGMQRNRLLLYEYSLPSLELTNSQQLIDAHNPQDLRLPFYYDLSPDSSQLLITAWSFIESDSLAQMTMKVFDENLEEVRPQTNTLPYKNGDISIYGCKVDNEANCYLLGDVYKGNSFGDYTNPNKIQPFVAALFKEAERMQFYELRTPETKIHNMQYELDDQQNLVAIGLFQEKNKALISGSTFFRIDRTTQVMTQYTQSVDKETFIAAFESNELGFKTPRNRFVLYNMIEVKFRKDAYYLIAEYFNTFNNQLEDILVMKIGLDGELEWLKRLPKAQKTEYENSSIGSFATIEQEESLLFFYNGNAENYGDLKSDKLNPTDFKNASLCVSKLELATGKIIRQNLSSVFPERYTAQHAFCKKIASDKLVIIGISNEVTLPITIKYKIKILKVQ